MTIKEKFITKGNVTTAAIALIATLATAIVCSLCGADRVTALMAAPVGGTMSVLCVYSLFIIVEMPIPMHTGSGVLGICIGVIASLIIL